MAMTVVLLGMLLLSLTAAAATGRLTELTPAALEGAQSAVSLGISIAGPMLLWCGVGEAMRRSGVSGRIAGLCGPLLRRLFPNAFRDRETAGYLSANVTANLLGLGNAATPMGIAAARRMRQGSAASDELCRFVVLNTASVQLLPTTIASVRAGLGSRTPFDILPAVLLSSLCSVSVGLLAARGLQSRWRR